MLNDVLFAKAGVEAERTSPTRSVSVAGVNTVLQLELKGKETSFWRVKRGRKIGPELSRRRRGLEPTLPTSCCPSLPHLFDFFHFHFMCTGNKWDNFADTFSMGPSNDARSVPHQAEIHNLRDGAPVKSLEPRRFWIEAT